MPIPFVLNTGDVVQTIAFQEYLGQTLMNVLHYQYTGSNNILNGVTAVDDLMTQVWTEEVSIGAYMRAVQDTACIWRRIQAQKVWPTRTPYLRSNLADITGDITGDDMPPNIAAVVTKQTNILGRGRTGSLHVGGLSSIVVQGGNIAALSMTDMNALAASLPDQLPVAGEEGSFWVPVIGVPVGAGNPTPLLGAVAQQTVRVMRRRTVGVGI